MVAFLFMTFRKWGLTKWLTVALLAGIALYAATGGLAIAQPFPACAPNGTTYPFAIGGTLEIGSQPTGPLFTAGGG